MNGIHVTKDISDDVDILVFKVVKPNLVTSNKLSTNNVTSPTNREPKYDTNWTTFKQTCNTTFLYHGYRTFSATAYNNNPDVDFLRHFPHTRTGVGVSLDR